MGFCFVTFYKKITLPKMTHFSIFSHIDLRTLLEVSLVFLHRKTSHDRHVRIIDGRNLEGTGVA